MAESFFTSVLLSDMFLKDCYLRGWLVGPNEDEKKFMNRKNAMSLLTNFQFDENILGFHPETLPVFFSKKKLLPWQAAAVFSGPAREVFQLVSLSAADSFSKENVSLIQLQPALKKGRYLFYSKEEILSHEMVHFFRSAFEENRYEEILAYRTSSRFFHRYFGPIFARPIESALFVSLLVATCVSLYIWVLVIAFLIWVGTRLGIRQKTFQRCLDRLSKIFGENANSFILSLTDKEIEKFAKCTKEEILKQIDLDNSLRWKQLKVVYRDFLKKAEGS